MIFEYSWRRGSRGRYGNVMVFVHTFFYIVCYIAMDFSHIVTLYPPSLDLHFPSP